MSLIAFVIGLFLFFKSGFRLGSRTITKAQSRSIGLILIAPLVLEFCASLVIVMSNPNIIQWSADGSAATINQAAFASIADAIGTIELVAVGIAVLLVIFTIYNAPKSAVPKTQAAQPIPGARPPDIMTVAEAAAYMRVTEKEVLGLIDQGKLGAARIGDTYRIARIAIEDFMSGAS